MLNTTELEYRTNSIKKFFYGGVRRSIIIAGVVALILTYPVYLLGGFMTTLYKQRWYNGKEIVQKVAGKGINYTTGTTEIAYLSSGLNDLYLPIDNKANTAYGLFPWVYTMQILDKDNTIIKEEPVRSYLLPGISTYVVAQNIDPKGVKINIVTDPQTVELPYSINAGQLYKEPNIKVTATSINPGENPDELKVRAALKNDDQVLIEAIDIIYILRDNRQNIVGIGKYQFNSFVPQTDREIIVNYPKPKEKEAKFVEIRWFVNYLDKNNISL
jgi:hypothetical protein